jgi:hypothetical protein
MQQGTAGGLTAWLRPSKPAEPGSGLASGLASGLDQAGFRAIRVLADREGYLFTEGLRSKG